MLGQLLASIMVIAASAYAGIFAPEPNNVSDIPMKNLNVTSAYWVEHSISDTRSGKQYVITYVPFQACYSKENFEIIKSRYPKMDVSNGIYITYHEAERTDVGNTSNRFKQAGELKVDNRFLIVIDDRHEVVVFPKDKLDLSKPIEVINKPVLGKANQKTMVFLSADLQGQLDEMCKDAVAPNATPANGDEPVQPSTSSASATNAQTSEEKSKNKYPVSAEAEKWIKNGMKEKSAIPQCTEFSLAILLQRTQDTKEPEVKKWVDVAIKETSGWRQMAAIARALVASECTKNCSEKTKKYLKIADGAKSAIQQGSLYMGAFMEQVCGENKNEKAKKWVERGLSATGAEQQYAAFVAALYEQVANGNYAPKAQQWYKNAMEQKGVLPQAACFLLALYYQNSI